MMNSISIFWFRRDLRLADNTALSEALLNRKDVLPLFIFDDQILKELPSDDPRVNFIYDNLRSIDKSLKSYDSSLLCIRGEPKEIWKNLILSYSIKSVYVNKDYEPYALNRDKDIEKLLLDYGIEFLSFKDQVIHEENEVLKKDGTPYSVFTPYKNKWLDVAKPIHVAGPLKHQNLLQTLRPFPSLQELGFNSSSIKVKEFDLSQIENYSETRNFPGLDSTSYLGPHLRFGTVSIRALIAKLKPNNQVFKNELIWREFFMQILFHYPHVVTENFKSKYNRIKWLNNEDQFLKWCEGKTGYPMVDAGMRQLNETGYMHNRVRMVTAGFLCKHLLMDWRIGEAYFAKKLLDYELSSNNGNWQWSAGTGCDAAPYFRIFNPIEQLKKFDQNERYVKKWIPELGTSQYCDPIIEHKFARERALRTYKLGLNS